jgi:glutamate-ammonia-ligase adenylyltransferase
VLAEPALRQKFDTIRHAVLTSPRNAASLSDEIVAMRRRVSAAHPVRDGCFDVKHSPGGMVDVEFAVQYLVLSQAAAHPKLVGNIGNIALLEQAQACGLLPPQVGHAAAAAYRKLRSIQHRARLDEAPTQVDAKDATTEREAVQTLWRVIFGPAPGA